MKKRAKKRAVATWRPPQKLYDQLMEISKRDDQSVNSLLNVAVELLLLNKRESRL